MNRYQSWWTVALMLVACGWMTGCGTTAPSRFYALQPLPEVYDTPVPSTSAGDLVIGVGPIVVAKYLQRSQIAVNEVGPEIFYSEIHRWAAPLDETIANVMVQNLSALLGSPKVARVPWLKAIPTDLRLLANISRFDGVPGEEAILEVQWTLMGKDEVQSVVGAHRDLFRLPVEERSYAALVSAQSELLGQFSRRVAEEIQAVGE